MKLFPLMPSVGVLFFLFLFQGAGLKAQNHEVGLTFIRTDEISLDLNDRVFEPSLRYTFSYKNFGIRAVYARRNTNQLFGSGTAYPSRTDNKIHYGALGLQYAFPIKRFELAVITDLGYSKRDYSNSSSNAKLLNGSFSEGEITSISLRPGLGLKYRLFKQLYLGVEFQQQLNWNHIIGRWEHYYFNPNPSIGQTITDSGDLDSKYFTSQSMLSGLIISWRF
ncbi:MAG: hypothetical protein AAFN10_01035 [Bacteroidota bacterium]